MELALFMPALKIVETAVTKPLPTKVEPPKFERIESNPFGLTWAKKLPI
jgi:hypothetical protein